MSILIGGNKADKMFWGSTPVSKVFWGSTKVWPSTKGRIIAFPRGNTVYYTDSTSNYQTWTSASTGSYTMQLYASISMNNFITAVGIDWDDDFPVSIRSFDYGATWTRIGTSTILSSLATDGTSTIVGGTDKVNTTVIRYTTPFYEQDRSWRYAYAGYTSSSFQWYAIAYGNGVYICFPKNNSGHTSYSTTGTSWTDKTQSLPQIYRVMFGGGKFVAMSYNGTPYYSTNGTSWTQGATNLTSPYDCAYGAGKYVTAAGSSGNYYYSTDAHTWTQATGITNMTNGYKIQYGGGRFFMLCSFGRIFTSENGTSWSLLTTTPSTNNVQSFVYLDVPADA